MFKTVVRLSAAAVLALVISLGLAGAVSAQDSYAPDQPGGDVAGGVVDGATDQQGDGGAQVAGDGQTNNGGAAADPDLAFTGRDFSLPLAVGAALVGSGALMYLAAAKRRDAVS